MARRELPKKFQGVERCKDFDVNTRVCVTGGKFGFSATWVGKATGTKLPIAAGSNARTPGQALRAATQSIKSMRAGVPIAHRVRTPDQHRERARRKKRGY